MPAPQISSLLWFRDQGLGRLRTRLTGGGGRDLQTLNANPWGLSFRAGVTTPLSGFVMESRPPYMESSGSHDPLIWKIDLEEVGRGAREAALDAGDRLRLS
jgi:hypothetical protein